MALSDRVNQHSPVMHGLPCSIGALLERLEGDERDALLTMLGTPERRGWSQHQIYDALTAEGYQVGRQTVNRHRARHCRCFSGGTK